MPGELSAASSTEFAVDGMGWPKMLEVTRTHWKGKYEGEPDITQMLHANAVEGGAEYCSVTAIGFLRRYYEACGITQGPLFRKFKVDKRSGGKVPVESEVEQECSDHTVWWASREAKTDAEGFGVHTEEGDA